MVEDTNVDEKQENPPQTQPEGEQTEEKKDKLNQLEEGHEYELADFEGGASQKIVFMKKEEESKKISVEQLAEAIRILTDEIKADITESHENTVILDKLEEMRVLVEERARKEVKE